ncbi:MAG: heavy metal translocating P-type ATPase [Planctomycetes bacterium]|nr:heavy metal translocating P-type ATPase [Planctomycetota bacterium]
MCGTRPSHDGDHAQSAPDSGAWWRGELMVPIVAGLFLLLAWIMHHEWIPSNRAIFWGCLGVVYLVAGWNAFLAGLRLMLKGRLDVDFLMVVAALAAAWIGEGVDGGLLLFLFSLGNALEHYAMGQSRKAIRALGKLAPRFAKVKRGDQEVEAPIEELVVGDVVVVRPGERLPADGVILAGSGSIDQSPITGESVPVDKDVDDEVFAGTVNGDGSLEIRVSRPSTESTMARMILLVEDAQHQKGRTQRAAEAFTRVYVPCVVAGTIAAIFVPSQLGWLPFDQSLLRAIAMLVGASPCALAISTPAAVLSGVARAARSGVLIKGGLHLEGLATIRAIAMDKTGTLTNGRPQIVGVFLAEGVDERRLLEAASAIEQRSEHPIAKAIVRAAEAKQIRVAPAENVAAIKGKGVSGSVAGRVIQVGSARLMLEQGAALPEAMKSELARHDTEGHTVVVLSLEEKVLGFIALADRPRAEAAEAIRLLHELQVRPIVMLTGDRKGVAQAIARDVGVDEVEAELLPEDKINRVKALLDKHHAIAMVGDGVNDAPALAMATVGIAMGRGGTDVALEAADIALMADDLQRIPFAIALARFARRVIRQNVAVSMGMVFILIPLALSGAIGTTLAVIMHEGSTVAVVINGLRLLAFREPRHATPKSQ